jgi:hypothetical protein
VGIDLQQRAEMIDLEPLGVELVWDRDEPTGVSIASAWSSQRR